MGNGSTIPTRETITITREEWSRIYDNAAINALESFRRSISPDRHWTVEEILVALDRAVDALKNLRGGA